MYLDTEYLCLQAKIKVVLIGMQYPTIICYCSALLNGAWSEVFISWSHKSIFFSFGEGNLHLITPDIFIQLSHLISTSENVTLKPGNIYSFAWLLGPPIHYERFVSFSGSVDSSDLHYLLNRKRLNQDDLRILKCLWCCGPLKILTSIYWEK